MTAPKPTREQVDEMARALMAEWERVEGKPVTESYVATFADMARVAARDKAAAVAEALLDAERDILDLRERLHNAEVRLDAAREERDKAEGAWDQWQDRCADAREELDALAEVVEKVRALADEWRYKGEFGWGPWQEGSGPDLEGDVLDRAAGKLLALLPEPQPEAGQ